MLFYAILGTVKEIQAHEGELAEEKVHGGVEPGVQEDEGVIPEFPKEARIDSKMIRCNRGRPVWV